MIRKAEPGDLRAIAEININAWKINYRGIIDDDFLNTRSVENFIQKRKEDNWFGDSENNSFVYEENATVKGFTSGNRKNKMYDCETTGLYVGVPYQGKGIGTKLLDFMKDHYRKTSCKNMVIWTIRGLPNNGFYLKNGGVIKESGEHEWGGKKYPIIGFVFSL